MSQNKKLHLYFCGCKWPLTGSMRTISKSIGHPYETVKKSIRDKGYYPKKSDWETINFLVLEDIESDIINQWKIKQS